MTQSTLNHGRSVALYTAAADAAIIAPTLATSGASIADLQLGSTVPSVLMLTIVAAGSCTFTDGTVYGYDPVSAKWMQIGLLNRGLVITLTAAVGYAQRVIDVGIFSRIAVSGTLSASTATISLTAIDHI